MTEKFSVISRSFFFNLGHLMTEMQMTELDSLLTRNQLG